METRIPRNKAAPVQVEGLIHAGMTHTTFHSQRGDYIGPIV